MSILVEAISIVVRRATLDAKYPGGTSRYEVDSPNSTFCADEHLTRIGFMDLASSNDWIARLESLGLTYIRAGQAVEIAVIDQFAGFLGFCNWLDGGKHPDGFSLAWLKGTQPGPMSYPDGWTPEQSRGMTFIKDSDALGRLLTVVPENQLPPSQPDGIVASFDLLSGQVLYRPGATPSGEPSAARLMAGEPYSPPSELAELLRAATAYDTEYDNLHRAYYPSLIARLLKFLRGASPSDFRARDRQLIVLDDKVRRAVARVEILLGEMNAKTGSVPSEIQHAYGSLVTIANCVIGLKTIQDTLVLAGARPTSDVFTRLGLQGREYRRLRALREK